MYALYKKSELYFALVWIGIYCAANSLANPLSAMIGIDSAATAVINAILTAVLFLWIRNHRLLTYYGLCKPTVPASKALWYLPLIAFTSHNLWSGAAITQPLADTVCYIVSMCCVGFLEEVIFRGFLFKALAKDNVKSAIVISSITFGVGHIINLFNGSGMDLLSNACQVIGAIACGFLFVILFHRGGSLIPCIAAHALNNAVSIFADQADLTDSHRLLLFAAAALIAVGYACILCKTLPKSTENG